MDEKAQQEKPESIFQKFAVLIPVLTVVVLVLGMLKQTLYYSKFDIPIRHYLGLTELGILISNDLLIILFVLVVILIATLRDFPEKEKNLANIKKPIKTSLSFAIYKYLMIAIFIWALSCILYFRNYDTTIWMSSFVILALPAVIMSIDRKFYYTYVNTPKKHLIFICSTIVLFLIFVYTAGEITFVQQGKYTGTKIMTNDSTYISSKDSYYIGKTEKCVFFYNKKDRSTLIIPTETIKLIKYKSW
jgi:hypothetical protein